MPNFWKRTIPVFVLVWTAPALAQQFTPFDPVRIFMMGMPTSTANFRSTTGTNIVD